MRPNSNFDVIIVGAGPAGITAAICLAKADFSVLVLEAGAFPGAENWSGAVHFAETLVRPDVLGLAEIESGAIERRVIKRGFYLYNGHAMVGLSYRNSRTFENCYTVLRPVFDHWLAEKAKRLGITLLSETTVESLIRHQGRIIGVNTDRGPVYADSVFLAEGDASHLVTKEGYERLRPQSSALNPKFLQGIKEVIELDSAAIERNFGVGPGEAACYEILLRNGILGNRPAKLNAGGFLYTNRESVSVGLVLPLDNLAANFNGDHNRLMEWFKALPEIQRWIGASQSVGYGAKIIRSGGYKELPQLVDDGLAIGGAATGIGIDFPYPNFTGPATAMGHLFAEALKNLRQAGQPFTKANLERFYEQPLRKTHFFKNVQFLRNWPGYVEHTSFFFGRQVDLAGGGLHVLSNPELQGFARWWQLAKFVRETVPLKKWGETISDLRKLNRAIPTIRLSLRALTPGVIGSFLLNTVWPFRRASVLSSQTSVLDLSFAVDARPVPWERFPWLIRRLLRALQIGLPEAAHSLYHNDETPIETKLRNSLAHVLRNSNLWDLILGQFLFLGVLALMPLQWICEMGRYALKRPTVEQYLKTFYRRWLSTTRERAKLDDGDVKIAQPWEDKLGTISYLSEKTPHIKVYRPTLFEKRAEIQRSPLWHICPAKVYECHTDDLGQSQIVVNWENCVKCESCWRGSEDVDWSRHRAHRLIYRTYTSAEEKVLELMMSNGQKGRASFQLADSTRQGSKLEACSTLADLLRRLALKIHEFTVTLHREPRDLDRNRVLWLQSIIQQELDLAKQIEQSGAIGKSFAAIWSELTHKLETSAAHASKGKFFWANSDGQQILDHHLKHLEIEPRAAGTDLPDSSASDRPGLRKEIESTFSKQAVKALDHDADFSAEQQSLLKKLAALAFRDSASRKLVFEELGRVEPSAALVLSHHLIGCELLGRTPESAWLAVANLDSSRSQLVPTALAEEFACISNEVLGPISRNDLVIRRQQTFGLTAARLGFLELRAAKPTGGRPVDYREHASNDLLSIALGASSMLIERATGHALTRVQFPGLFKDENGRDGVGKFGSVKKQAAEMEASRYLLETLSYFHHSLTPEQLKLITAEIFGTMPGSVSYNAGQIVGGPAFSEDDIYSKFYRDSGAWSWLWWDNPAENLDNFAASALPSLLPLALPLIAERNRKRQEAGIPSEKEVEIEKLLREISARRTTLDAPRSTLGQDILRQGYFDKPLASPIPFRYEELMHAEQRYNYGDFLIKPADIAAPRYLPEHLQLDKELAAFDGEMRDYFRKNFADRTAEGLSYARYIEKHHKVPEADVFALIDRGLLRMTIPKEYGGEGLTKAHYYVLITNAMRYGEPGVSLTIQANTSIGTTPIILGLNQDLPRARKDLENFLKDDAAVVAIGKEIERIQAMLNTPAVLKVKDVFIQLGEKVKTDIGKRPMLRSIASDFINHFMQAARAGQRQDLKGFAAYLEKARSCMPQLRSRAEAILAELGLRAEGHKLFLHLISSGQIAAFALTEPGAGSDSAGVQTRAVLKKAEVFTDPDGTRFFYADPENKQRRNLVEMQKIKFEGRKMFYLGSELHWPDPGEGPAKPRWYESKGKRIEFFDIGTIRPRDGKEWFEYYEMNGAKMWITNAHIAGVFTLYAKTPEGVTGFMVDRFAEGMNVGKDEEKMGQRGSPTNELGLSAVRVPRECVMGIEGRGQVNALETLNVGRAGLCVSTVAMMLKIVEQTRSFVKEHFPQCLEAEDSLVLPAGFDLRNLPDGVIVTEVDRRMGMETINLSDIKISDHVLKEIPTHIVRKYRIVPVSKKGNTLVVAISNPLNDIETLDTLRFILKCNVEGVIATKTDILKVIRKYYGGAQSGPAEQISELFGAMTEELYAAESLAYELIGLFDHKGTESVRMESAIGKYYGSEALHRIIRWAEAIHGAHSQTAEYEIEKHRRDARVLNIYEGTNEVQRFLMLKDLAGEIFTRWSDTTVTAEMHPKLTAESRTLNETKDLLKKRLGEVLQSFGQQIWQNPGFQAAFFRLCDIAGFVKTMDSVLRRTQWLLGNIAENGPVEDVRHRDLALQTTRNYMVRVAREIETLDRELAAEFTLLKQGIYPPNIRVATLLFEEHEHPHTDSATHPGATSSLASPTPAARPCTIAVMIKPVPLLSPRPHVRAGKLIESHFEIGAFDRGALIEALHLKRIAPHQVALVVLSAAPAHARELLQQTLAMGADEAVWINVDSSLPTDSEAARMLADALRGLRPDLVLTGSNESEGAQTMLGTLVADDLNIPCMPRVTKLGMADSGRFVLEVEQFAGVPVERKGPLVVTWATPAPRPVRGSPDHFTMEGYLRSFAKPLRRSDGTAKANGKMMLRLPEAPAASAEDRGPRTAEGAARMFARAAGLEMGVDSSEAQSFGGEIILKKPQDISWKNSVVFLAEPPSEGFSASALQSLEVAVHLAAYLDLPLRVVILVPGDETRLRRLASKISSPHLREIVFVSNSKFESGSETVYLEAVQKLWTAENHPSHLIGPSWANELLARFANFASDRNSPIHLHSQVKEILAENGSLAFVTTAFGGKVEAVQKESSKHAVEEIITLAAGANFVGTPAHRPTQTQVTVSRVNLDLAYDLSTDAMARLWKEATQASGAESIKDAEFIIDVGYAIANKENYEVVIAPLKQLLEQIGVKGVQIGGSRKVVEELKLLAADQQIGQTGVSVNPTVVLAIGISGAPQHLDYIGEKAVIIAFNKDPQAPIMTLNQRRARPKVYPVAGDLFKTVPQFMEGLKSLKS